MAARRKPVQKHLEGTDAAKMAKGILLGLGLLLVLLIAMKAASLAFPDAFAAIEKKAGEWGLVGTFVIVFLGSTLLPFPTDAWFVSAVSLSANATTVVAIAVAASWIAGVVNYVLARYLSEKWVVRKLGPQSIADAKRWSDKYGGLAIILFGVVPASPIIDPLTFVAGFSEMDFKKYAICLLAARIIHFGGLALLAAKIAGF
ncbi:MAG: VTT domain-containing protein [Candidatus Micrarchaeota archaeon]